ncbi:MAG TPA: hypothetical protein P5077_05770 [bacterium]|nr:hypothetical protein [bacterium]
MGWYGTYTSVAHTSDGVKKHLIGEGYPIQEGELVGKTFYAAVLGQNEEIGLKDIRYAMVFLCEWNNGQFLYKPMDEFVNPYYYDCPKRILDLLSPLSEMPDLKVEYQHDWRKKVYDRYGIDHRTLPLFAAASQ